MTAKAKLAKQLTQTITIKRDEAQPESVEILAKMILEIADSFKKALNSGLKKETIVTLIQMYCDGVGKPSIRQVLDVASRLGDLHLNHRR